VRHGHAGRKDQWHRSDRLRPLDARGRRQADNLVGVLLALKPTRIISSGHLRCIQTMEPLASAEGIAVERSGALTPEKPMEALSLVRQLGATPAENGTVLCTHGEVMGIVLNELANEDSVVLEHRPPGLKGCVWVLDMRRGKMAAATYIPPPVSKR